MHPGHWTLQHACGVWTAQDTYASLRGGGAGVCSSAATTQGKETATLKGHSASVDQLCWHPSQASALATASADKSVRVWDARCTCWWLCFALRVAGKPANQCFHRPPASKCVSTIATPGENINIEWSPNGQLLAVGNKVRTARAAVSAPHVDPRRVQDECVCMVDVRKGKVLRKIRFKCEVNEMAWHPAGICVVV